MPCSAIDTIILVTRAQEQFWCHAEGWASSEAADLLAEARLDRQLSFAHTLYDYIPPFTANVAEARQIVGYATLRSLCEGALKLFFSVWFEDYRISRDAVFDRKQTIVSPEDIAFDKLIALYVKKGDAEFEPFLRRVQHRGNGIHHFSDRDVGSQEELVADICSYKDFLLTVNGQLPYPDDYD